MIAETSLKLRAGNAADRGFLYRLHQATMKDYISRTWGWDELWQRENFEQHFDPDACRIISLEDKDIGVLVVRESETDIFIREIQIQPAIQNKGIGTYVLQLLLEEAKSKNRTVGLQVLKINPARDLYKRLGFRVIGEDDLLYFMEAL